MIHIALVDLCLTCVCLSVSISCQLCTPTWHTRRLCHRYDEVSTKVYGTPADTQELVDLVEYVKEVSTVTFYQMNDEVKAAAKRLLTLLDYANFSGMWRMYDIKSFLYLFKFLHL